MKSNNEKTEKEGLRKWEELGKEDVPSSKTWSRAEPADTDQEGTIQEMTLLCWMHLRDWEGPGEETSTWEEHTRPVEIISSLTNNAELGEVGGARRVFCFDQRVWPGQRVSGDWSEMRQAEASEILPALIGGFS